MSFWETVITSIISALFSGTGILAYLKYRKESRTVDSTFESLQLEKYQLAYSNLERRVVDLENMAIISKIPEFRKDNVGRYISVNKPYEFHILGPIGLSKENVIGKDDATAFKAYPKFADKMQSIDRAAFAHPSNAVICKDVQFPGQPGIIAMVVHEVADTVGGQIIYVGRIYQNEKHDI